MKSKYTNPRVEITEMMLSSLCGIIESGETYDGVSDIDAKDRDEEYNEGEDRPGWDVGLW